MYLKILLRRILFNRAKFLTFFILPLVIFTSCRHSTFNGERAFQYIEELLVLGFRIPGSLSSIKTADYIRDHLERNNWSVEYQDFIFDGIQLRNIIAKKSEGTPDIILGTHYDTRQTSDQENDPYMQSLPVPGANDGASGTALLIELSRHIIGNNKNIWLVFFDAEDQGEINGWPWSLGAEFFASSLSDYPQQVVIVDMIGDQDLEIYIERNSNPELSLQIWDTAEKLGNDKEFIKKSKFALIDDHVPFLNRGISSALIIDFDYPYWHTQEDTLDKVSGDSLRIVGEVLLDWIY